VVGFTLEALLAVKRNRTLEIDDLPPVTDELALRAHEAPTPSLGRIAAPEDGVAGTTESLCAFALHCAPGAGRGEPVGRSAIPWRLRAAWGVCELAHPRA